LGSKAETLESKGDKVMPTTMIEVDANLKPAAYAWPGGYQMFYLARAGWRDSETGILDFSTYDRSEFVLCPTCAGKASERDFILTACDINYEDKHLYCEECSERIPTSYFTDEEMDEDEDDE
jgi:hypothetical protein